MLKNSLEHCIELDDGNDEEATTSTITNSCKISPANITNDTNVITTVHTKIGQAPSNHLTSQSTLISTTPATTLFNESVLLDEDYDEVLMESLDTLQSETRLSGHSDVSASASASTSMTGTAKAMQDNTLTQQQQKQEVKVAGPQQQQQRRLSLQEQKLLRQQNPVEKVFPHVATTHQKLRLLMSRSVNNTLQQQLLKAISAYIVGCRHEYEESTSSPYKCRRLAHSMTRTLDLIQQMCASFEDTPEYIHRMIELIAIYLSCELRYAKEFKEHKPLIANRILHNIYKNLKGANSEERLSYIFRMFAHTPRLYREREVMTKIFQCLIPKPTTCPILQRELPDKLYIQYIIVFYHWKQLELNQEEQIRVIEFANQLIRPAKSLCTNSIYAHNLPKYSSTQTATKFILHDLKFFHDLRNASIYDHRLQVCTEVIDISSDEEQSTTPKPSVDINFAELVENAEILPITRPMVKLENQIVIATIDLTLEDKQENEMEWLQELQRNAKKLEPTSNGLSLLAGQNSDLANSSSAGSEVIEIDSDSAGEEENDEVDEPENLLLEEPERLTNDFADFEEPDQDDQDLLENNLEEKKSISTKSQNKVDVMNSLAIKELSKDEVSSLPLSQQLTQVYPTKLNIISVRSIGATQTDEKSVGTQIQLENTITPEKLPAKSHSTGMYSIASTQTEESFCESTFEKNANANQLLPSKPTIIEVRSIAKNKSDNYTSTQLDTTTSERAKTQVNPEISKTLNAELVNRPGKQVMASVRNDYPLSNVEDSFSCRRDSLHLYSSPVRAIGSNNDASDKVTPDVDSNDVESEDEEDEDEDNDEMCFFGDNSTKSKTNSKSVADSDEFNSNRVIYSVAASTCPPLQQDSTDFMSDDDMTNFKPQIPVRTAGQKKLVKFSNKPLQRTAGKPITHPIKPAIKNTSNSTYNIIQRQSTPTINSIVSRFGSASPASSTSSLPRTLSKEHLSAFRDHYTDAEKRQVLHRQCLPFHLQRSIQKSRFSSTVAPSYSSSSCSSDGPPYGPEKLTFKDKLLATNNSRKMHNFYINHYQDLDENLRKKCCVVIERNYELDRNMVHSLNKLLQMQREKRQRAMEKRQEEERKRVLKDKLLEEQMLKEQITELRRQQKEKRAKRRKNENAKRKESKGIMRMQLNEEQLKLRQHTVGLVERTNLEDTQLIGKSFSNQPLSIVKADVKPQQEVSVASMDNVVQEAQIVEDKKDDSEVDEEELERRLLRTPTPSPDRALNSSATPKSSTKSVKVRIKRIWKKNRRGNILEKEEEEGEEDEEDEEHEQENLLDDETDIGIERISHIVSVVKTKIRSPLNTKDASSLYSRDVDDDEGDECEEENVDVDDAEMSTATLDIPSKESEATPSSEECHVKEVQESTIDCETLSIHTPLEELSYSSVSKVQDFLTDSEPPEKSTAPEPPESSTVPEAPGSPTVSELPGSSIALATPDSLTSPKSLDSLTSLRVAGSSTTLKASVCSTALTADKISDSYETPEASDSSTAPDPLGSSTALKPVGASNITTPSDCCTNTEPTESSTTTEPLNSSTVPEAKQELATQGSIEKASGSSGLAMLANTAATAATAATIATPEQPPSIEAIELDALPSTSAAATATAIAESINEIKQNGLNSEESELSNPNLTNSSCITEIDASTEAPINNTQAKQYNLELIDIESTPTVPPYLFNGESRDAPTPTPVLVLPATYAAAASSLDLPLAESAPSSASVDSTHAPEDRAALCNLSVAAAAAPETIMNTTLSTSDHEVSSTQETLCEILQLRSTSHSNTLAMPTFASSRNISVRRMSLFSASERISAATTTVSAAVQNNQVDTTHHLPESTTTTSGSRSSMRRRVRKLSTNDDISTDASRDHSSLSQQPVHKRRKTICADASFRLESPAELLVPAEREPSHASSSPSTTVTLEKIPTRKRGRTTPSVSTVSKRKPKHTVANSTPPPLPKLMEDSVVAPPIKCSSPGVSSKSKIKNIKHTYSLNNMVTNVFVPPEIEVCLENENDTKSLTKPPKLAKYVREKASTSAITSRLTLSPTSSLSSLSSPYSALASPTVRASTSRASTKPANTKEKSKLKSVQGAKVKLLEKKKEVSFALGSDSVIEEKPKKQQPSLKNDKHQITQEREQLKQQKQEKKLQKQLEKEKGKQQQQGLGKQKQQLKQDSKEQQKQEKKEKRKQLKKQQQLQQDHQKHQHQHQQQKQQQQPKQQQQQKQKGQQLEKPQAQHKKQKRQQVQKLEKEQHPQQQLEKQQQLEQQHQLSQQLQQQKQLPQQQKQLPQQQKQQQHDKKQKKLKTAKTLSNVRGKR